MFVLWNRRCLPIPSFVSGSTEHFEQPEYTGIDYERLYAITTAFRRVLERPPTEAELQEYKNKLSLDPEFDIPALEVHLRQSAEFKRLVGTQKNSTLAEIDGVVSEQAIRGKLADMYTRITGQTIDDVTMELLYSRYRHTNLSDAYITALIQQMADVSKSGGPRASDGQSNKNGAPSHTETNRGGTDTKNGYAAAADGKDPNAITIEREWLKSLGLTDADLVGGPSEVLARLKTLATSCRDSDITKDTYAKGQICARERQRMLDSIGYDEGDPVGSWTMPKNRDEYALSKARSDQQDLRASAGHSSLSGSLLPPPPT
jgi:hypothetical protein